MLIGKVHQSPLKDDQQQLQDLVVVFDFGKSHSFLLNERLNLRYMHQYCQLSILYETSYCNHSKILSSIFDLQELTHHYRQRNKLILDAK